MHVPTYWKKIMPAITTQYHLFCGVFKSNIQDCVSRGPRSCNPISGGKLVIVSVVGHKPNLLIYYEALLLHNPIYYFMLV